MSSPTQQSGQSTSAMLPLFSPRLVVSRPCRYLHPIRCYQGHDHIPKKRLVFLGTPQVAAEVLNSLLDAADGPDSIFEVAAVVTQPPSIRGRGRRQLPSPVAQRALERNFPPALIFSPETAKEDTFLADLKELNPAVCVTAAYGNYLPKKFLDIPTYGTVNIHPSLLPKYRGAAPVQRAVQSGESVTGVTVAYTVRAMDAGPIIASETFELNSSIKAPAALQQLFQIGTTLLLKELSGILDGTAYKTAREQDDVCATHAPKVNVDESWLSFEDSATVLHNKIRAFAEWPGTKTKVQLCKANGEFQELDLKIITSRVPPLSELSTNLAEGKFVLVKNALAARCGDGSILEVLEVQPPGKKVMTARDFWNGLRGEEVRILPRATLLGQTLTG